MDDPSPNRRTTAFDICHSLWPGFGRATTRAHPAGAPGCGSNVHDLFSVRNMFYSQTGNVFCEAKPNAKPKCSQANMRSVQGPNDLAKQAKTSKNKRLAHRARRKVMGGFPKRSDIFIQNLRPRSSPHR